jgi:integrase
MKLKINFILKTGIEGEIPVLAIMNFGYKEFDITKQIYVYKPLRYYTGVKVNKTNWDSLNKLPTDKTNRAILIQLEKQATDIFNYLSANETVTPNRLKQELDIKIKGKQERAVISRVRIVDFIENEILHEQGIKPKTKESYKTLKNRITDYEKKLGRPLFSHELTEELYNGFMDTIRERSNRINTVWSIYKTLKSVLNRIARKYKLNNVFNPTKELRSTDKPRSVTEDKIYLRFDQIQSIMNYEAPTEELANAKLILLTLLFTGCRYSDVHKIKPEHTYTKNELSFNYARYFSTKTDTEVVVPILKPLQDAIDANGGKVAYPITSQRFNGLVKTIANDCELNDEITLSFTNAHGKKELVTNRFHDFVSSHIGRRSFVSNLISYIPITVLSKITGHATTLSLSDSDSKGMDSSEILKYNKISLVDNAVRFVKMLRLQVMDNPEDFPFDLV